jgi:hypothetical protein
MTNAVKGTCHKTVGLIFSFITLLTIIITIIALLLPSS